jgi:hypothetical protein
MWDLIEPYPIAQLEQSIVISYAVRPDRSGSRMIEFGGILSLARFGWSVVSGSWRFLHRHKRTLTSQDKLQLRNKWKPQFADYLGKLHLEKLRSDVVIRDIKRMDSYPEIVGRKGISAWFRVDLIDTYERGIMVGLRWEELIQEPNGFRYVDWAKNERGGRKVVLTGYIPYENIESVDWEGDRYYGFPHIYCYFSFKGEPYERLAFCELHKINGWPYYTNVANYSPVRKRSKKVGIVR